MRLVVSRDLYVLGLGLLLEVSGRFLGSREKALLPRGIGAAAFHLSRQKRIRSLEALSRVFPDLSSARREAICRRSFVSFWEDLFDLSPEWTAWSRLGSTSITGLDHLESALAKGRGTVLWESNGFGFRNHAKKALAAQGFRVVQIHLETHFGGLGSASLPPSHLQQKVLTPWYERLERCFANSFIYLPRRPSLAAIRRIEEALAENRIVCSAADGRWGYASMEQRFLGHPTRWFIGMLSLSRLHGVPVLPLWCWGEGDRREVAIGPPLPEEPTAGREEATAAMLRSLVADLEATVLRHPHLYRGWHRLGS